MSPPAVLQSLFQVIVLLAFAILGGRLAARFRMPRMVGELAAGLLLGPTLLGVCAPQFQIWLAGSAGPLGVFRTLLYKLALLVFLFVAGMETALPRTRAEGKRVLGVSFFGLGFPFLIAWTFALAAPGFFGADGSRPGFPLFLGIALSISALPVIARIFMDLHLDRSPLAATVLSAAAIDDVIGWGLFMCVLQNTASGDGFFWETFGALVAGALCGKWRLTPAAKVLRISAMTVFAPLYFVSIGLKIDWGRDFSPMLAGVLWAIACVGKIVGGTVGARLTGAHWRDALAVGCAMNARGAMEIILATMALDQGVIGPQVHAALVFVAIGTSLMAGPCLSALGHPRFAGHKTAHSFSRT